MNEPRMTIKQVKARIDELLAERRPDRYTVGGLTEDGEPANGWLTLIADEVAPLLPDEDAKKMHAWTLVMQREGGATRSANQLLRHLGTTGQLILLWAQSSAWPMSVESTNPDDRTKKIDERVALRAVTVKDSRVFASVERRRAAKDLAARDAACIGAEMAADGAESLGLVRIWDYFITLGEPPDGDEDE